MFQVQSVSRIEVSIKFDKQTHEQEPPPQSAESIRVKLISESSSGRNLLLYRAFEDERHGTVVDKIDTHSCLEYTRGHRDSKSL